MALSLSPLSRVAAAVLVLTAAATADTPDPEGWSRFRGPNGSGISTSTRLPAEFGPDKNVVWKTALPFGHSSPALTRERIFLTAARADRLVTICLDRRTGAIRAVSKYPHPCQCFRAPRT
jgi:outer membrane protein assembly factor BamB